MLQAYDTDLGIFDHLKEQAKLDGDAREKLTFRTHALVEMHPMEDRSGNRNQKHILAKKFADMRIGEIFNISFIDFLSMTPPEVEDLFTVAQEYNQVKLNAEADNLAKINSMVGAKK